MTRRNSDKRLAATQRTIDKLQPSPQALNDLCSRFLETGDLPTHLGHARHVVDRVLVARRGSRLTYQQGGKPIAGPARERVFREATHPLDVARIAARELIRLRVRDGFDPSDPEFIPSECSVPDFGTTALHLLGWPDALVHPDREHQMERVMRQHAEVRSRGPRSDLWFRDFAAALAAFLRSGQMPTDDDLRLAVLTIGEMFALNFHYLGKCDRALPDAFDAVANATDETRDAALRHLSEQQARWQESHASA